MDTHTIGVYIGNIHFSTDTHKAFKSGKISKVVSILSHPQKNPNQITYSKRFNLKINFKSSGFLRRTQKFWCNVPQSFFEDGAKLKIPSEIFPPLTTASWGSSSNPWLPSVRIKMGRIWSSALEWCNKMARNTRLSIVRGVSECNFPFMGLNLTTFA